MALRARGAINASLARPLAYAALLASMLTLVGCKNQPRPGDLSDSAFVGAMAELRRAVQPGGAETTRDSAGRQGVRDSILRKYHATGATLESTASHLADRPAHANEILLAIDRKVEALARSTPPRPTQPPPPPNPPATRPGSAALPKPGALAVPQPKPPTPVNPPRT